MSDETAAERRKRQLSQGWIGVDLDGTLAEYHGWPADGGVGAPVTAMRDRVIRWLAEGYDVRIFTARVSGVDERPAQVERQRRIIEWWCDEHLGRRLPITCTKDFRMIELWDDRAVQVVVNTGARADGGVDD